MVVRYTNKRIQFARQPFQRFSSFFLFLLETLTRSNFVHSWISSIYEALKAKTIAIWTICMIRLWALHLLELQRAKIDLNFCLLVCLLTILRPENKNGSMIVSQLCETCSNYSTKMVLKEYFLCIGETLYPSRNKIVFRQYNPSKPAKYGLLFNSINAVTYTYTHNMIPYCGKPNEKPTSFYVKRMEETVKHLVQNLQSYVDLQGRNISFDRLYTTVSLAQWLLFHNITCAGTLQSNRKGIPKEVKDALRRDPFSYKCYWESTQNKLDLHSYVVTTKSFSKRNALLLLTVQPILGVTNDDRKKKSLRYINCTIL